MVQYLKTINSGTISAGGTVSKDWTADRDYVIKKVWVVNRGTAETKKIDLTIQFGDHFKTLDYVNAYPFEQTLKNAWEPNESLGKGERVYVSFKNNDTSNSGEMDFVMLLESAY